MLSFLSDWKNKDKDKSAPAPTPAGHAPPERLPSRQNTGTFEQAKSPSTQQQFGGESSGSGSGVVRRESPASGRRTSRPSSMVSTYQPALMEVNDETLPELQPIFTFLNSHANKLYQEGYFLKLDDQNSRTISSCTRTISLTPYRW